MGRGIQRECKGCDGVVSGSDAKQASSCPHDDLCDTRILKIDGDKLHLSKSFVLQILDIQTDELGEGFRGEVARVPLTGRFGLKQRGLEGESEKEKSGFHKGECA
jgi:hypothetical protein